MTSEQWYELIRGKTTLSPAAFFEIHRQTAFAAAGDVLTDKPRFAYRLGQAMWREQQLFAAVAFFEYADLPGVEYAEALVVAGKRRLREGELAPAAAHFARARSLLEALRQELRPSPAPDLSSTGVYPAVNVMARLKRNPAAENLDRLEADLFFALGNHAELAGDPDAALAAYDRCQGISTDLRYVEPKLEHHEVKPAIARLLREQTDTEPIDALLVNVGLYSASPSYALLSLGTHLLRLGYRVRLLNRDADDSAIMRLARRARLVGFSVMTDQIGRSLAVSRRLKNLDPRIPIVWGGVHPTLYPEQTLAEPAIDYVVVGDGEEVLVRLVEALKANRSPAGIPGVGRKEDGRTIFEPPGEPFDLTKAGTYAYELIDLPAWCDVRIGRVALPYPVFLYYATRGCPWRCTFCVTSVLEQTRGRRAKKITDIIADLRTLRERVQVRCIIFPDEYFFGSPKWFGEFLDALEETALPIIWGCSFHMAVVLKNKKLILRAKDLGLRYVSVSPESGSDRVLEILGKKTTVEQIEEVFDWLTSVGLAPLSSFMTHLPGETAAERRATFALRDRLQALCDARGVDAYLMGPQPFRPYPGTLLFQECIRRGYREPQTLEEWPEALGPWGHSLLAEEFFWVADEPEMLEKRS